MPFCFVLFCFFTQLAPRGENEIKFRKGRELPLRANTVTQHPKYKHRGRQKSRHLPGALGWLAKNPPGSRTLKAPQVQKTAHPSPAHPPNPCPAFKPPSSGWADRAHPGSRLPRLQPRKNNFQSIQRPRPPCKRSLPKTLSLLGKITALKGNCRHDTSSGFMTKKKRENKTTSRGVGLHSPR